MHFVTLGSRLSYEIKAPTVLLINLSIATTDNQSVVTENLNVDPYVYATPFFVGLEGNRFNRLILQPGFITIEYTATAQMTPMTDYPPSIDQIDYALLPPHVLTYLNPSRYCESDKLSNFAFNQFGHLPPNFERVNAICDWIFANIQYVSGTTNALTTASDVLQQRTGVCRDFAHLAISFCRALGVPARYVSGYACRLQPPDFHGFFEAYLDGNWYLFDPTRLAPPAGLVRIGVGRDAADTSFATIWGDATLTQMSVWADEQPGQTHLLDSNPAAVAVSTA